MDSNSLFTDRGDQQDKKFRDKAFEVFGMMQGADILTLTEQDVRKSFELLRLRGIFPEELAPIEQELIASLVDWQGLTRDQIKTNVINYFSPYSDD